MDKAQNKFVDDQKHQDKILTDWSKTGITPPSDEVNNSRVKRMLHNLRNAELNFAAKFAVEPNLNRQTTSNSLKNVADNVNVRSNVDNIPQNNCLSPIHSSTPQHEHPGQPLNVENDQLITIQHLKVVLNAHDSLGRPVTIKTSVGHDATGMIKRLNQQNDIFGRSHQHLQQPLQQNPQPKQTQPQRLVTPNLENNCVNLLPDNLSIKNHDLLKNSDRLTFPHALEYPSIYDPVALWQQNNHNKNYQPQNLDNKQLSKPQQALRNHTILDQLMIYCWE